MSSVESHSGKSTGLPQPARGRTLDWTECLAASLLSAVYVCRLLTPTDAVMTGETIWIAQLALLALVVWAFSACRGHVAPLQFDRLDVVVSLLCLGHVVGAVVVLTTTGDKRSAATMLWEWIGVWAAYFVTRRLVLHRAFHQQFLLVVAVTGALLGAYGVWQHHWGFGETRTKYVELKTQWESLNREGRPQELMAAREWDHRVAALRNQFAQMNIPGDDGARMLWEQRLFSVEPLGLFALTNTLAGVLVVAVLLWSGTLWPNSSTLSRAVIVCGNLVVLCLVYGLLLTKSRTALVGLLAGGTACWLV
ncbi:MAG: hypothetical protein JSS02_29505, partial [Planctomycetes bacterium]|nr:hypothetical protein [Planctomycetota bacterium]